MKLMIVGNPGGTNVADSFLYGASTLRIPATLVPSTSAFRAGTMRRRISWHLLGHKPPLLNEFSRRVHSDAQAFGPTHMVATGLAPITAPTLQSFAGVRRIAYLTDDPWNPQFAAKWFMDALPHYDVVYTTRRANVGDLTSHGCRDVRYLPFGYDPRHFFFEPRPQDTDVFFAGGAEPDRVAYLKPLLKGKWNVALAGDRWDRFDETRLFYKGHFDAEQLRRHTASAHVNVCLVRGSNRDGHVMRSFEIPASGGCMVAQDTPEHRAIFGQQRENVLYFRTPDELYNQVKKLLADETLQQKLARSAHHLITTGKHTYTDRLQTLLAD